MAGLVLLLSAPIQGVVALVVWRDLGRPIIFRQTRPGKDCKPFGLIKFRTMKHKAGELSNDADRLTPAGRFLRETSLDELPELWNVLRGDMSLVGPRPLLMQYLGRYSPVQARRHEVRPGLTGLAQVMGRNDASWDKRLRLDVEYVEKRCWRLDLWIIAMTFRALVRREGITARGHATMPEFTGVES
ncbi:MAG: sugar transferase [Micrococcales bacterium]|nr:sugar transferase [Micrococcales bacterium]